MNTVKIAQRFVKLVEQTTKLTWPLVAICFAFLALNYYNYQAFVDLQNYGLGFAIAGIVVAALRIASAVVHFYEWDSEWVLYRDLRNASGTVGCRTYIPKK